MAERIFLDPLNTRFAIAWRRVMTNHNNTGNGSASSHKGEYKVSMFEVEQAVRAQSTV